MKTDNLIKSLSADVKTGVMPMRRAMTLALFASVVLAGLVFLAAFGPRPDIDEAMGTMRFAFKFVVTLLLALTAWFAVRVLSIPGETSRRALLGLLAAPVLLLAASVIEMMTLPAAEIMPRTMGQNSRLCLIAIPLMGLLPLAAFLAVARHGAPTTPGVAGAVAGLLAGGIAATFYAAHCTDDSPLFVAVWYTMAVGILAMLGTIAGRALLRW